eukprot:8194016-Pyramimonas_sp.AAC.1
MCIRDRYEEIPDLAPPTITLLGAPNVQVSQLARYQDAGAVANDDQDPGVTVTVYGLNANNTLNTTLPTPPGG